MMKNLKTLLFSIIIALAVATIAFAWTNPSQIPPGGGGALYYSGTNVGIGTTGPGKKFEVRGEGVFAQTGTGGAIDIYPIAGGATLWTNSAYDSANPGAGWASTMTFNAGKVGIGTATPGEKLSVAGKIEANADIASGVALEVNNTEAIWYNGTYFSWGYGGTANYFANNVGIGTTSPGTKVDVSISDAQTSFGASTGQYALRLKNSNTTNNNFVDLVFTGSANNIAASVYAQIVNQVSDYADLGFWTRGSGGFGTRMTILSGGNVGIGTTGPGEKLEVSGNIKLSGASPTYKITNVASPTADSDAATKGYVDAATIGITYKGTTATSYTGNLGGAGGANAKCQISYSGSHMCRQSEMISAGVTSVSTGWVNCEAVDLSLNSADNSILYCEMVTTNFGLFPGGPCGGWLDTSVGQVGAIVGGPLNGWYSACTSALPVHCCK